MTRNPLLVRIGRNVKRLREALQITQAALAERAELADETISRLERGVADISVIRLQRVARGLGCSVSDLIGLEARIPKAAVGREMLRLQELLHGMPPKEVEYVYQGVKSLLTVGEQRRSRHKASTKT